MRLEKRTYNNKFPWTIAIVALSAAIIIAALLELTAYFIYPLFNLEYVIDWHHIIRDFIIAIVLITIGCWMLFKCVYQINGDRLIVKEGLLGLNMDIPISTIKEVRYTPIKKRGKKAIHLIVGDNTYILKANTHSEELYRDLSQLITLSNEEKSHIKFHKQQKQ